jgi:hypothetical protein
MRAILLLSVLLLAGCTNNVRGPWQRICDPPRRLDDPRLTIREQEALQRSRIALPEPSMDVAPRTYSEYPDHLGRLFQ